jgi:hypothetical protein
LPKGQGGFGVIDFDLKAKAFAIQWIKRYFAPTPAYPGPEVFRFGERELRENARRERRKRAKRKNLW